MNHSIEHDLGVDIARRVANKALESYKKDLAEYEPEGKWLDPNHARVRFKALGKILEGQLTVLDDRIDLELEVPLLFRPFRAVAIRTIEEEIRAWIAKARAGQLGEE